MDRTLLGNEKQLLFYREKQASTLPGNITFAVNVIRISLLKRDRSLSAESAMQGSIIASQ
jgi:hypothetical protein